jgi:hypothetical protein
MICHSYLNLSLISGLPRKGYNGACIVFSLERRLKRENMVVQKPMDVWKGCKYSHHSYIDLSLISGLPRKGIFSLLNEYRRETEKGEQKGRRGISALRARCQDARVLNDNRR